MEDFFKLLVLEVLVDNFDITKLDKKEDPSVLRIYLIEKGDTPKELSHLKLHSKGFFEKITIRDFAIRHYKVFLPIKRRKWKDLERNKNVARNWELVANGTGTPSLVLQQSLPLF